MNIHFLLVLFQLSVNAILNQVCLHISLYKAKPMDKWRAIFGINMATWQHKKGPQKQTHLF